MKPGSKEFWRDVAEIVDTLGDRDYYEILKVPPSASAAEIGEAYRTALRTYHPDQYALERASRVVLLTRLSARINEANRILSAPGTRKAYDETLAQGARRLHVASPGRRRYNETRDPMTAEGRSFYDKGCQLLGQGELAKAKAQLVLALSFEAASPAIRAAHEKVTELLQPKSTSGDNREVQPEGELDDSRIRRLAEELFGSE